MGNAFYFCEYGKDVLWGASFFVRYVRARNINKERVGRLFLLFETNNPFLLVVLKGFRCYNETKKRFYNLGGVL